MARALDVAILGLSLRSAWGNGHATTFRALVRAMLRRGHRVRFYERDCPWYAENQDLPEDLASCLSVAARRRALAEHTAEHRVRTLEGYIDHVFGARRAVPVEQEVS